MGEFWIFPVEPVSLGQLAARWHTVFGEEVLRRNFYVMTTPGSTEVLQIAAQLARNRLGM